MKTMILFAPQGPNTGAEGMVTQKFVEMLRANNWCVKWLYQQGITDYPCENRDAADDIGVDTKEFFVPNFLSLLSKLLSLPLLSSLAWSIAAYKLATTIMKQAKVTVISSRIMPKYGHLPALLLAHRYQLPWHANWSDPMPESRAPYPYGQGERGRISFMMKIFLHKICNRVTLHSFPSTRLMELYLTYLPVHRNQCMIIPHLTSPIFVHERSDSNKLVISYVGGGLSLRNPLNFFTALSLVRKEINDEKFQINFIGPKEQEVCEMVNTRGVCDLVNFIPPVSHDVALEFMKSASINLVLEANMENGVFLPSKVADIVSCKTPILTISPQNGVMHDLIAQYGGGIWADCNSVDSIADALRTIIHDWNDNRFEDSMYSTKLLEDTFSPSKVYGDYVKAIHL